MHVYVVFKFVTVYLRIIRGNTTSVSLLGFWGNGASGCIDQSRYYNFKLHGEEKSGSSSQIFVASVVKLK